MFLQPFQKKFQSKVSWQKLSSNCKEVQINFEKLALIQKRMGFYWILKRTEEQMKKGELVNAKVCLDLARDFGRGSQAVVVDESVLQLINLIQTTPPDLNNFKNSIQLLVSSQAGLIKFNEICTSLLLDSSSAEKLIPIAVTALAETTASNCDQIKNTWSKTVIDGLPSSRWSLMTSSELVSILKSFNQMGLSPTEALPKMLDDIQDQVINTNVLQAMSSDYKIKINAL